MALFAGRLVGSRPLCNSFHQRSENLMLCPVVQGRAVICEDATFFSGRHVMSRQSLAEQFKIHALSIVVIVAALIVVGKAFAIGQGLEERFAGMGNDDILRLTLVQDLIGGQGWFDQSQYRMVPPEGLPIHWSRYIDAGIAALIIPLAWFLPMADAELIGAMLWPTLILLVTVAVVAFGTRRIFGTTAACFAVACLVLWPLTADLHARPGNLDHHNVQYLSMVVVLIAIVWPSSTVRAGAIGGLAAAFSLAVGLENLAFIMLAGAILLVRAASGAVGEFTRLKWFCALLFAGALVLWLGQASTQYRFALICDQLGVPLLTLIAVATLASLTPFLFLRSRASLVWVLGASAVITAIGMVVTWPVSSVCLSGPYAALPQFIQEFIEGAITEARPGLIYAQLRPAPALLFVLPVVASILLALGLLAKDNGSRELSAQQRAVVKIYAFFCLAGVGLVIYQMRTVNLAATPVPMLAGAIMASALRGYLSERSAVAGAKLILSAFLLVVPTVSVSAVAPFLPEGRSSASGFAKCRSYEIMQSMNEVPPAVVLAHGNFGPLLIWATHHSALAAPYHRSAQAMSNAILPFQASDETLESEVRATGAEMLMLCKDHKVSSDLLNSLSEGASLAWLKPVEVTSEAILLFEVLPE